MKPLLHVVVCHGYTLGENPKLAGVKNANGEYIAAKYGDWEKVCLGSAGRICMALRLASELDAARIIWSTGASQHDGCSEARYMWKAAFDELQMATHFRNEFWLQHISTFEEKSINTAGTMQALPAFLEDLLRDNDNNRVMLHNVTSANHLPRVMREAVKVFGRKRNVMLGGTPSLACYGDKTNDDVVIYDLGRPSKVSA